jgi:hypothetical protein
MEEWVTVLGDEKKASGWRQGGSCRHVARDVTPVLDGYPNAGWSTLGIRLRPS